MLPQRFPVTMRQVAVWLEEHMTKLVAADEAELNSLVVYVVFLRGMAS